MFVRKGSGVRFQNQGSNSNNKVRVRGVSVGLSLHHITSHHITSHECRVYPSLGERERSDPVDDGHREQNGGPIHARANATKRNEHHKKSTVSWQDCIGKAGNTVRNPWSTVVAQVSESGHGDFSGINSIRFDMSAPSDEVGQQYYWHGHEHLWQ